MIVLPVESSSCAQNKGFSDPQECWSRSVRLHRSQIPPRILHIQPGLLSDSPVWASAFSQHYFSTSLSGLNRLHYLRRHLTIFYHRTGTEQHRTGRDSPPNPEISYAHYFKKAAIFLGLARRNTKIHPASVEGDVAFLSLLGGAVISHLVNPHLKSRYPPRRGCSAGAARSIANLRRTIDPRHRLYYGKTRLFDAIVGPNAAASTGLFSRRLICSVRPVSVALVVPKNPNRL